MPFLSICIPTYNQPTAVDHLLNAIVEQLWEDIEVVICDDSENSDTEVIVNKYSKIIPIVYVKRSRDGLDKAVLDLVDMAKGAYVWWIGDDEILPGGIARVVNFLMKENPDFLWVNSVDKLRYSYQTFDVPADLITYNPNDLLSFDLGLLGFITATIFRRELAVKHLKAASLYQGSAWACLYLMLCVVTSGGKLAILKTPCFSSLPKPSGEIRWYDQFQVFGINLLNVVLDFSDRFDKKKLKSALNRNLERVLQSILVERALGYYTGFASPSVSVKPLIVNYYRFHLLWLYFPLLFVPSSVLKVLYSLYKKINGKAN